MLCAGTLLPTGITPTLEPLASTASRVTSTGSSGAVDWTVIRAVIILVRLAISRRAEASCCHSTRPLERLNSRPALGGVWKGRRTGSLPGVPSPRSLKGVRPSGRPVGERGLAGFAAARLGGGGGGWPLARGGGPRGLA